MAYVKQTWANDEDGGTPISAARLNYIENGINNSVSYSCTPTGIAATDTAALIAAAEAARVAGTTLRLPDGIFEVESTVTFDDIDVEADPGCIFQARTAITVIKIGTPTRSCDRKTMHLPVVKQVVTRDDGVGIQFIAADACDVWVPWVRKFGVGLALDGDGQGVAYNTITIGHLDDNGVNLQLAPTATGWANQNTIVGGRLSHDGSRGGPRVAGTKQIYMGVGSVNNNTFLGTSMEGDVAEWLIDTVAAANNLWLNCRYETTANIGYIRFGSVDASSYSQGNRIIDGNEANLLNVTEGADAKNNHVITQQWTKTELGDPGIVYSSHQAGPILTLLTNGETFSGNPLTEYLMQVSAVMSSYKAKADAFPKIQINHTLGRLLFGAGNIATSAYFRSVAGNQIEINTGDFLVATVGRGLRVKEGSNAKQGVATLVAGTVTVANTSITANSRIFLTIQSLGTVVIPQPIAVTARTAATSFTITSADATDTSVVGYQIFEPA